jgi:hypothetical protein
MYYSIHGRQRKIDFTISKKDYIKDKRKNDQ